MRDMTTVIDALYSPLKCNGMLEAILRLFNNGYTYPEEEIR